MILGPASADAQEPPPATPPASAAEACTGFFCQLGNAISEGAKQGMGGKSFGEAITSGVKDNLEGKTPQLLGYVNLGNGSYLTFFDNNPGGFPSTGRPLALPPKPGTVPPAMALVPVNVKNGRSFEGAMLANNIEEMKKAGVFVAGRAATATPADTRSAADESRRTVPRVLALHEGVKFQTSVDSCDKFDELDADNQPTGRQVRVRRGALVDAMARCEARLSAFREAQMDALEKEDRARAKKR